MGVKHKLQIYTKYQLQQAFVDLLSIPKYRRRKFKRSTKFSSGVKKAALRGKCTSVIEVLSKPRNYAKPRAPLQYVRKSALLGRTTSWNELSSLPKLHLIRQTKQNFFQKLPRRGKKSINRIIQQILENYKEMHPPDGENNEKLVRGVAVHRNCYIDPKTPSKYISDLNKKEKKLFVTRMNAMSKPLIKPVPPPPDRGPKKPIGEFQRTNNLAVPLRIRSIFVPESPRIKIKKKKKA